MSAYLIVPLHLKGIYVDRPMSTVGPTADFSYLPWNDGRRDYNSDYAPLGEYLETTPLESANGELQAGIHLHWTLPPALCRQVKSTTGAEVMPYVPVKWNIIPVEVEGSGNLSAKTLWSDYLHSENTPLNLSYANVPIPYRAGQSPYRYMGIATELEEAPAGSPAFYREEPYLGHPLTCMGYGSLSFASFYPDCREVFGHYEPLEAENGVAAVTYFVRGLLYRQSGDDTIPLNRLMRDTGLSLGDLLDAFEWPRNADGTLPEEISLAGAVKIDTAIQAEAAIEHVPGSEEFALGHSGTEALSALLAADLAGEGEDPSRIEEQLEAILMGNKLSGQGADLGLSFADARHDQGFRQIAGGNSWSLRPVAPTAATETKERFKMGFPDAVTKTQLEADLNEDLGQLHIALAALDPSADNYEQLRAGIQTKIDKKSRQIAWLDHLNAIAGPLIELNLAQQQYDIEQRKLASMKQLLFGDWYKLMLAKYPPPESLEEFETTRFPPVGEIASWIQHRALGILNQTDVEAGAGAKIAARRERLRTEQTGSPDDAPNTALTQHPADPFYEPADPVLLIAGLNIPRPELKQHNPDLRHHIHQNVGADTGAVELERQLYEKLFPRVSDIPTNDPWNPFILEWEAEFLPAVTNTGPDAVRNSFTLDEHRPEARLKAAAGDGQATTMRGRTYLSPGARVRKMEVLGQFLKRRLPPSGAARDDANKSLEERAQDYIDEQDSFNENNALLTAARAYVKLAGSTVLSQALSGFNDALLQLEHHLQTPLVDPLGGPRENDFSQDLGQLIGDEPKPAPNPASPFLPVRAGSFRLTGLRLIDAWGRYQDLIRGGNPEIAFPKTLSTYDSELNWPGLPLRLSQPLRLNFNYLTASTYNGAAVNITNIPYASPVVGWICSNRLDGSLLYFNARGQALGYFNRQAEQDLPPGAPAGPDPHPVLQDVLDYAIGTEGGNDPDAGRLQAFLDATDGALSGIAPNDSLLHSGVAMLTGRPMAVVRIQLSFELFGLPAIDRSWATLKAHLEQLKNNNASDYPSTWQNTAFPIRLGNAGKLNDGLVGFWREDEAGRPQGPFYVMTNYTGREDILPHQEGTLLWLPLDGSPITLTLLIDPRGSVHATTGILPVKAVKLRTELYAEALERISTWFLQAPLLQPEGAEGQLHASPPMEAGYRWSWVAADNDHNAAGVSPGWRTHHNFIPSAQQAKLEKNSVLREGWLKLEHE